MTLYPKDPQENLKWRAKMLRRAKTDLLYREKLKRLFWEDPLFVFNGFFYTLDVREKPFHHQPFCTYPYQDEAILSLVEAIQSGRDEVWEKSRDMGATWCILGVFFWFWLDPRGGSDFLVGSRKEDYVDRRGDPRTLFAKLRYLYARVPKWLRPKGFNPRTHDTYMKFENPETGSTITGESNNPAFSTAGRYTAILYDEFAKWEGTDEAAWTAGGDASPCRIANSTPFGAGGQYYKLVNDGKTKKITMHWSLHPKKGLGLSCVWPPPNEDEKPKLGDAWEPEVVLTSPWYEKEKQRRSRKEVAQELDIDYIGAGNPVFAEDEKAWRSLQMYHRQLDRPKKFFKLDLEDLKAKELKEEPLEWEGHFLVYEPYQSGDYYTIGVDVVEGVEDGDYAFVVVYNRRPTSVDATYYSQVDEVTLARVVYIISQFYSPEPESPEAPWCGIETTGPGLATFDAAVTLGVVNLFMAPRYDVTKGGVTYKKGWRTDTNSRNELIAGIRKWLADGAGKLNNQRLCGELMTFVRSKTGKPEAKSGCHDDGVMAFGIAIQVDELAPNPALEEGTEKPKPVTEQDFVVLDREAYKLDEPTSIQDRCLAQVLARQSFLHEEELFFDGRFY